MLYSDQSIYSELAVPRCMGYSCSFFFFCIRFFVYYCRPGGRSYSRVTHALSLWLVMAWFQSVAISVVPIIIWS